MSAEPVVAIAAIEHYAYCPRQCALIHVDGVWADNAHTVRGVQGHRRVDAGEDRTERGKRVLRAVPLWSERLGLSGRSDAVEVGADGSVVPVEYKIGARHGDAAHLQLCAQGLCLEEMLGQPVTVGALWFSGPRRRQEVQLAPELRARTLDVISEIRSALVLGRLPPPVDDERCRECQLVGYCLPGVVGRSTSLARYMEREVFGCGS